MKNISGILAFLAAVFVLMSCASSRNAADKTTVSSLSGTTSVTDGSIVYALPRSVFNIVVEMERTIEIPGPYRKYAGDLLGLDNVIQNENENWTIEGISVESGEELDPSEFYVVESSSLVESNAFALRKEGLILDLDPAVYYTSGTKKGISRNEITNFMSTDLGSDEYSQIQRDTAFKRVSLDSSFVRIPYIVEKRKKLSDEQLAERAAKRLMEMRDGKHMILTGESNVFPQNEAAINEMNRMEKEYTELFTGKTLKEKRTYTYQLIPTADMQGKPVKLFQFSDMTGPAEKGGDPVTVVLTPENKTKPLSVLKRSESDEKRYDRLFYRVPDVVNMKITLGDDVLFNSRRLVYQFGQIIQLPANYIIGK